MRKRKPPPNCDCCGVATQEYESELWPGFGLCFQCWRVLAKWFVIHDLIDENPLAEELLGGVWVQMPRPGFFEVVHDSLYESGSHASSHRHCKRIKIEE